MSDAETLRGMAAAVAQYRKGGRGGGGKRDPRGALNAAHIILVAAGTELTGGMVVIHALGLGLWRSDAEHPRNGIVHVMDDEAKKTDSDGSPNGVIVKPGPGLYAANPAGPEPLPVTPRDVATADAELYAELIDGQEIDVITI